MKPITLIATAIVSGALFQFGCHYRVTNPESGSTYYTTSYKDYPQSGSIRFKDHRTGKIVTLDSWETEEIPKNEFKAKISEE